VARILVLFLQSSPVSAFLNSHRATCLSTALRTNVQHQNLSPGIDGPGQRDAPLLAAAEICALLPDDCLIAVGQAVNEILLQCACSDDLAVSFFVEGESEEDVVACHTAFDLWRL
jgi:hypothetical protein